MKTKLLLATVMCLWILASIAHATPPWIGSAMQWKTPMVQESIKINGKTTIRSSWDGQMAQFWDSDVVSAPDARAALGLSDEQYQQILDRLENADMNEYQQTYPGMQEIMKELEAIRRPDDPYFQNMEDADEETQKKYLDISERQSKLWTYSRIDFRNGIVLSVLTEDQKQKLNEAVLSSIAAMPVISPNVFDVLGLTDAQKQKMTGIKKEHESEFEKVLENVVNGNMAIVNKVIDEFEKQGGDLMSGEDFQDKIPEITKKLMTDDPEVKKIHEEIVSLSRQFAMQFKMRLFDALTDEQWKRLQQLTDDPPEHIKILRKKLWENMGRSEETEEQDKDAPWCSDDAIPEEYRQKRKRL